MSATSNLGDHAAYPLPVRSVPLTQPFTWIKLGWEDLSENPGASLAYGLLVSMLGAIILGLERHPYFLAASISGFLLVGPIMTAGLCELSRKHSLGEAANFDSSLHVLKRHRHSLLRFANALLLCSLVWLLASTMMLHIALGEVAPGIASTVWGDVLGSLTSAQLISYTIVGGILASVVFALSVVSIPLIIDRNADASEALSTSVRVTLTDLPAMIVWAAIIAVLVGVGFASFLTLMIVIFPLLGHATWHAYQDLVQ
jgi:uncharacterized membrane protein